MLALQRSFSGLSRNLRSPNDHSECGLFSGKWKAVGLLSGQEVPKSYYGFLSTEASGLGMFALLNC